MFRSGSRGFALAVSVFALVVIAALIAGVFFAARQQMRLGENELSSERAFDAAEAGLHSVLAQWDPGKYDSLPAGGSASFSGLLPGGTGSYSGTVLRLNRRLLLIRSTGQDPSRESQRSLASVVRLMPVRARFGAAISVTGQLVVGAGSLIRGEDHEPVGWDCPPAGAPVAGVAVGDASSLSASGCADSSCIHGEPAISIVPSLGDSTTRAADAAVWATLVAMATNVYDDEATVSPSPVGTAATCDTSARDNWGEVAEPPRASGCRVYYPIVYARGNLRVSGGGGQGVLLVSGDLRVGGGFAFHGPVVVRGMLIVEAGGSRFVGGVRAAGANLQPGGSGSAEVAYSSCALANTLLSKAGASPLAERGWAEIF